MILRDREPRIGDRADDENEDGGDDGEDGLVYRKTAEIHCRAPAPAACVICLRVGVTGAPARTLGRLRPAHDANLSVVAEACVTSWNGAPWSTVR